MAPLTPEQKTMVRQMRWQTIVIAVLTVALIAALFQIYFTHNQVQPDTEMLSPKYIGEVHDATADSGITNYNNTIRRTVLGTYRGVWFDTADLTTYLHDKLPGILKRHTDHQAASNTKLDTNIYKWKLGYYWLVKDRKNDEQIEPALSYYVVPILVSIKDSTVLDYFNTANNSFYDHPPSEGTTTSRTTDRFNVYDEGHLWP